MSERILTGRTALVTGGAKRVGKALCLALAEAGADVIVHHRDSGDAARALADELTGRGAKAWTVAADFEDPRGRETLIDRTLAFTGGALDILVNNASIFPAETIAEATFESLERNMAVNAWTPLVLSRAFARRVGRGDIINLIDARIGYHDERHVGYTLSKHALSVLTRMTAVSLAPGIRVNGIAPGLILPGPGMSADTFERLGGELPLGRPGSPEDIARAAVFLLSAPFVTGVVLPVDGGMHLRG